MIVESGARDAVESMINEYHERALKALHDTEITEEGRAASPLWRTPQYAGSSSPAPLERLPLTTWVPPLETSLQMNGRPSTHA